MRVGLWRRARHIKQRPSKEAKSGIETTEESKAAQGAAGKAAPASPHQEQALEEPGMHFTRLDQDQDGRISKGEVKGDRDLAENWDRLDNNGDGSLSPEEFAKFSRQAPNLRESGLPIGCLALESAMAATTKEILARKGHSEAEVEHMHEAWTKAVPLTVSPDHCSHAPCHIVFQTTTERGHAPRK